MRAALVLLAILALSADVMAGGEPPAAPADPTVMAGSPPPSEKRVTLENWQWQPFSFWSFMHVERVMPVALVDRGGGEPAKLEVAPISLMQVAFDAPDGTHMTVAEGLKKTDCNGFILLRDGKVVFEYYANGLTPRKRHLIQSAGKSLAGTLAISLVHDGALDANALVTDYIPEMKGSAYEGATVRHVLNMTAGVHYREDYYDPTSEVFAHEISHNWKPKREGSPVTLFDFLPTLKTKDREHGVGFEYCSAHTDLLGWIIERATGKRMPAIFSERLWSRLGAGEDLAITVDDAGSCCLNGGVCISLRDFARFGQMMLQNGFYNGQQIVAAAAVEECFTGNHETFMHSKKAKALSAGLPFTYPKGAYTNQWWVGNADAKNVTTAVGSFGNKLYIDRGRNVVMARLSTQRVNADPVAVMTGEAMLKAMLDALDE